MKCLLEAILGPCALNNKQQLYNIILKYIKKKKNGGT